MVDYTKKSVILNGTGKLNSCETKKYQQEEQLLQQIGREKKLRLRDDRLQRMAAKCLSDFGFVERKTSWLIITEKGEIARQLGINRFLHLEKLEKEILGYSAAKAKRELLMIVVSFFLLIMVFLFMAETKPELFSFFW